MTDFTPESNAPIVVEGSATRAQLAVGLRDFLKCLGVLAGGLGLARETHTLNFLAANADSVAGVVLGAAGVAALVWSQVKTRINTKKAAAMADMLPGDKAVTK